MTGSWGDGNAIPTKRGKRGRERQHNSFITSLQHTEMRTTAHTAPISRRVVRPRVLSSELLDHVADGRVVERGAHERVADDALELVRGEGDDVLLEVVDVHVGRELGVGHRGCGGGDHRRPCAHVHLVDVLDHVF